jgi:hypothetical protein
MKCWRLSLFFCVKNSFHIKILLTLHILCLSCNLKKPKTTPKLSNKRRNKHPPTCLNKRRNKHPPTCFWWCSLWVREETSILLLVLTREETSILLLVLTREDTSILLLVLTREDTSILLLVFGGVLCEVHTYSAIFSFCRSTWLRYQKNYILLCDCM